MWFSATLQPLILSKVKTIRKAIGEQACTTSQLFSKLRVDASSRLSATEFRFTTAFRVLHLRHSQLIHYLSLNSWWDLVKQMDIPVAGTRCTFALHSSGHSDSSVADEKLKMQENAFEFKLIRPHKENASYVNWPLQSKNSTCIKWMQFCRFQLSMTGD